MVLRATLITMVLRHEPGNYLACVSPHPVILLIEKFTASIPSDCLTCTELDHLDLVNHVILINTAILRLNHETILVLLVLSMCTMWITLDLTWSLDRLPPSHVLVLDPPVVDHQVDSIDIHIMRQKKYISLYSN